MQTCFKLMVAALTLSAVSLADGMDEVRKAELGWAAAVKSGDLAAIEKVLSKDLVYTHSTAIVEDKAQYLTALRSGNQKYASIEHLNPTFRVYSNNTGVVTSKVRMTGTTKGVPFDNQLYMIHVWVKMNGMWQLVAHQTTKIP